jgi:hypothetical protein
LLLSHQLSKFFLPFSSCCTFHSTVSSPLLSSNTYKVFEENYVFHILHPLDWLGLWNCHRCGALGWRTAREKPKRGWLSSPWNRVLSGRLFRIKLWTSRWDYQNLWNNEG